jgi:hypothetical protein
MKKITLKVKETTQTINFIPECSISNKKNQSFTFNLN